MAQRLAAAAVARCSAAAVQPAGASALFAAAGFLLGVVAQRQAAGQLHSSALLRDGGSEQPPSAEQKELDRRATVNRMLYRSRQRGFLELDLLIGMWAEREVPHMSPSMLEEFEVVLDQENPDMFKWLTAQEEAPEELLGNRAFLALRSHVKGMTDAHHSVPSSSAAEAPKEWVRGWTDSGKELSPQ